MKRFLLIMIMAVAAMSVAALEPLSTESLFDGRYRDDPSVTETVIKGKALKDYDLKSYRSLTFAGRPDMAEKIAATVTADGAKATDREVSYRAGKLYYAFYAFDGGIKSYNRYILYLNQNQEGGNKIIVVLLEGDATLKQIKKMFKHKQ